MRVRGSGVLLLSLLASAPAPAQAQTTSAAAAPRWELEVAGGLIAGRAPKGGTLQLPPAGPPITTSSPIFPSRSVPSWFFGDGTRLLNDVNAALGVAARVTPLDDAIAALTGTSAPGAGVSFRVRSPVTSKYIGEVSLDILNGTASFDEGFTAAAEITRRSFESAMAGLLATGPFTAVAVTTSQQSASGSGRELALTGAIVEEFGSGGLVPYLTLGGGVIRGIGSPPASVLQANYRFRILNTVPIDETDRLAVAIERRTTLVGVAGGGIKRQFSGRWGLRIDARALIGPANAIATVSSTPSATSGTPADFIESGTSPSIQFSNDPATGRRSSLGLALDGVRVFRAKGIQTRVIVSVGITFK